MCVNELHLWCLWYNISKENYGQMTLNIKHSSHSNTRAGFALPTVLIASVVLLTILVVSVTATTSIRTTLLNQHYTQLAKIAGEAGVEFAKACLQASGNVPTWTTAKPLTPATDCNGDLAISPAVSVLLVGGGGGGGEGGGGAGGVVEQMVPLTSTGGRSIVAGAGGTASSTGVTIGGTGGNSTGFGLTAYGGGAGATTNTPTAPAASGSGGGGRRDGGGTGGASTMNQGNAGGSSIVLSWVGGAGGGGAGSNGLGGSGTGAAANEEGGNGGTGTPSSISGEFLFYAGGGGGGTEGTGGSRSQRGLGGLGGGGNGYTGQGGVATATAGTANTGGGGGGRPGSNASGTAGAGGSGVVIVSYPVNSGIQATGGTRTVVGANVVHRFTSSSATTFNVTNIGTVSCPTDPRCSVLVEEDLRTSFRVTAPGVDSFGKAVTIPQTGYTEVLRKSTGAVWRTVQQPSIQSAAVPDLCSGSASSARGWSNAVVTSEQFALAGAPSAQSVSLANGDLSSGKIYLRKDFTITTTGRYVVRAGTSSSSTQARVFYSAIGATPTLATTATGTTAASGEYYLQPGCYTLGIELSSLDWNSRPMNVSAAMVPAGGEQAVVVTDSSWRVASGNSVHYSDPHYDDTSSAWTFVEDVGATQHTLNNGWEYRARDRFTQAITTAHSATGADRPANSTTYFRDSRDIELAASTEVRVTAMCDDNCSVYIDGQKIADASGANVISAFSTTLSAGSHRVGVRLTNGSGPSRLSLAVVNESTGTILTRTDATWKSANSWATSASELYAYDATFIPTPSVTGVLGTYEVMIVGGGGGSGSNAAGGGGGGGVRVFAQDVTASTLNVSRSIYVGTGGAGATNGNRGAFGGASGFAGLNATSGGGGASRDSTLVPTVGSSGGGGAGAYQSSTNHLGANGSPGGAYGNRGGNGTPMDQGCYATGGGGGGAGGVGGNGSGTYSPAFNGTAGDGGTGYIAYYTGSPIRYGAGGAGSITCNGTNGRGDGEGSAGNGGINGVSGAANTGGGGGASGGSGGSGVVIVRVPTGAYGVTATGTYNSGNFNGYTFYRFTGAGTFRITSVNGAQ